MFKYFMGQPAATVLCLPTGGHFVLLSGDNLGQGFETVFIRPDVFKQSSTQHEGHTYPCFDTANVYVMEKTSTQDGVKSSFTTHRLTWALLFSTLTNYSGIGDKKACQIIEKSPVEDVELAATTLQPATFLKLKGCPPAAVDEMTKKAASSKFLLAPSKAQLDQDAVKALVALGIDKKEADARITFFMEKMPRATTSELTSAAIRNKR